MVRRWLLWLILAGMLTTFALGYAGCGSGSDEIFITCNNAGSGDIVCGANGGSSVDRNVTPAPRR